MREHEAFEASGYSLPGNSSERAALLPPVPSTAGSGDAAARSMSIAPMRRVWADDRGPGPRRSAEVGTFRG